MRLIKKKISLEPFKSRNNFKINSYYNGSLFTFTEKSDECNYGMIPTDVIKNAKIITYSTMMRIYYFMKNYNKLLKRNTKCTSFYSEKEFIEYKDSVDYYNNEVEDKSPTKEQYYIDLKNEYDDYVSKLGNNFIDWVDNKFDKDEYGKGGGKYISPYEYLGTEDVKELKLVNCINIPILMTNTIDDIGELTTFSKEWESGDIYNENDLTTYENEIFKKNSEPGDGSIFSTKYKESYFGSIEYLNYINSEDLEWLNKSNGKTVGSLNQWDNVTENYFKDENNNELPNYELKYAYKNGNVIINPTKEDMRETYKIDTDSIYCYKNNQYKSKKHKYIINNSNKYVVFDIMINNVKLSYTIIDDIKYYSIFDSKNEFINYKGVLLSIQNGDFIEHNNEFISIDNNRDVKKLYGIVKVENKIYYINLNKKIVSINNIEKEDCSCFGCYNSNPNESTKGYEINGTNLYIYKPYKLSQGNELEGKTETKLSCLYTKPFACDNLGKTLPCSFNKDNKGNIKQPDETKENNYLGFICQVGNTSNLENYGDNKFWGNILDNIKIYYKDNNGNIIKEKYINGKNVNDIVNFIKENENNNDIIKKLYCDITYYMGAIINLENNNYFYYSNGVEYTDTTYLTLETTEFNKTKTHMFLVKYFKINYDDYFIEWDEFDNKSEKINISSFKIKFTQEHKEYRDKLNGIIYAPTFREDYKFGSSSLEKVDSNIYIDRGISNAFEKHLKLLDVSSLESLEQYGNGFYNIIKN